METMENIKGLNLDHCLRPEFTQAIIGQLVSQRTSVNLIGAPGTGKGRLLEDICQCHLPGVQMVCVDLKTYVMSYNGLLREIHGQLGLELAKQLTAAPADRERLEKSIYHWPMPYAQLCFLADQFNIQMDEDIKRPFKKRLKQWQKEFKRLHNATTAAKGAIIASGLNKFKIFFQYLIEFIKAWRGK